MLRRLGSLSLRESLMVFACQTGTGTANPAAGQRCRTAVTTHITSCIGSLTVPPICTRPIGLGRQSTHLAAQQHRWLCSAAADAAVSKSPLQQAGINAVQPPSSHGLSPEQAAAVFAGDGHLKIVAGPGSGKTRVLTARVEHLIRQQGCKPWQLVVITFSNKAARELQERLETLLGANTANQVVSGTFHSVGCQIVRRHVQHLGSTGREIFAIFDQDDTKNVMKLALKKHFKLPKVAADGHAAAHGMLMTQLQEWEQPKQIDKLAKRFRHDISLIKNGVPTCFGLDGKAAVAKYTASGAASASGLNAENDLARAAGISLEQAYDIYEAELKQNRGLDFDDLLSWPVALLQNCINVREKLQKRYKHILVDEFQDTNAPQYELVRLLAGTQANVFVVGDPDQAIYGWRGANVVNMSRSFTIDYPGSHTLQLKDNYRSTPQVLRGAEGILNNILSTGTPTPRTPLVPFRAEGPDIEVRQVDDERAEADFVVHCIQQRHRMGEHRWRDMAILYRTNTQSRLFEEQLVKRNIPYQIIGGTPFWLRKEVKDVMAYVKLAVNPEDDVALARVINQPTRGIGQESQLKLKDWAEAQGVGFGHALFSDYQACIKLYEAVMPEKVEPCILLGWPDCSAASLPNAIPMQELGLSKKAIAGVEDFCRIIMMTRALLTHFPVATVLNALLEHINFEEFVQSGRTAKGQQNINRWHNVQQVIGAAEHAALQPAVRGLDYLDTDDPNKEPREGLAKVQNFLEQVALWSEPEKYAIEGAEDGAPDVVNVMTLHLSKGLEFDAVFIVGCEDALMPHGGLQQDLSDPRDLERHNEEVRLLYVGMTRAKKELVLTHAKQRALRGGTQRSYAKISPFLASLPRLQHYNMSTLPGQPKFSHATRGAQSAKSDDTVNTANVSHGFSDVRRRSVAQLRAGRRRR